MKRPLTPAQLERNLKKRKLSPDKVARAHQWKAACDSIPTAKTLAKDLGISVQSLWRLIAGKTYKRSDQETVS